MIMSLLLNFDYRKQARLAANVPKGTPLYLLHCGLALKLVSPTNRGK